ncbi:MAG TPA: LssY C-terminal domain-containing protein [Bryobacteraceae bacterium]|nr:LssY C-terminal domain-containing protein [Bryobacteraceae bacterium]
MVRSRNWLASSLLLAWAAAAVAPVAQIPAGTEIQLRLKTKVASNASKAKDPVEAIVLEPVMVNGAFAIPAGTTVRGVVESAKAAASGDRAQLALNFNQLEMGSKKVKLATLLTAVDNAREQINDKGQILGILSSETISGELDSEISKVTERYSGLGDILGAAKGAFLKPVDTEIVYSPGVELTVKLTQPVTLNGTAPPGPVAKLQPVADQDALVQLVNSQPFQTVAQKPPKPSDMTNLMFIGSEELLRAAFADAGWSEAAALSTQSKLETFRAIAEVRGYKEAPVSVLLLDGQAPSLVFEKLNNTFAQRHHLRVWRRPVSFEGKAVWVCSATHDTGIAFSEKDRTFIHKIDPQIDRERAKVVSDLLLTGKVRSLAAVERPLVPRQSANATGDQLLTDGQMAVVILQ